MINTLFIPIRVRQIHLEEATQIASASADFSRLPYFDPEKKIIVNNDSPFISENVVTEPFEDDMQALGKGNHLHFILPTPFTHSNDSKADLPVPNRWLVSKVSESWVIESDAISKDPIAGQESVTTIIPVPNASQPGFDIYTDQKKNTYYQPFRYLGRKFTLDQWQVTGNTGTYWKDVFNTHLTAFAYGDPQFATRYPDCRSVFGFYDQNGTKEEQNNYLVVGWFQVSPQDNTTIMANILADIYTLINEVKNDTSLQSNTDRVNAFFARTPNYGWLFNANDFAQSTTIDQIKTTFDNLDQIVFYGQSYETQAPQPANPAIELAIGNNGVEALSSFLAAKTITDVTQIEERQQLENKLEAIQFDSLKSMQIDLGAKFEEARHDKGFKALPAGKLWGYSYRDANGGEALSPSQLDAVRSFEKTSNLTSLANLLNVLNQVQATYEKNNDSINSKQQQLFSDWYKYMLSAHPPMNQQASYPNADEVLQFIKTKVIPDLDSVMNKTGLLVMNEPDKQTNLPGQIPITTDISIDSNGNLVVSDPANPAMVVNPITIATDTNPIIISAAACLDGNTLTDKAWAKCIFDQLAKANLEIDKLKANKTLSDANLIIYITLKPGARYYQPNDPTLLISGDVVPSAVHEDLNALPACSYASVESTLNQIVAALNDEAALIKLLQTYASALQYSSLPWHPVSMEWAVAFYPLDNSIVEQSVYDANFLTNIFELPPGQPNFEPIAGSAIATQAISAYRGFAHLTPYAFDYLNQQLKPYASGGTNAGQDADLAKAYTTLSSGTFSVLSQSLSGFNEAFMMRKRSLQLAAIVDPIAFDDYKKDIANIERYINHNVATAPLPSNDFNPIRGGGLNITHLNLIDTFGQKLPIYDYFKDNNQTVVYTPQTMTLPTSVATSWPTPPQAFLYPRYIQPSRMHFRWLSKDSDQIECGVHFLDSPICGWVVHNILDDSLMVYDYTGHLLGSIGIVNNQIGFIPKPESVAPIQFNSITNISNKHLQSFVNYFLTKDVTYYNNFLTLLVHAQEYTDPDSYAQHPELALLMGKPLALVRTKLNFELKGDYVIDESWDAFRNNMQKAKTSNTYEYSTDNFEAVEIPIRLGDYQQLNDGLMGFWADGSNSSIDENSTFYSPVKNLYSNDPSIVKEQSFNTFLDSVNTEIKQSPNDAPQYFTMLFDPRSQLNITAGLLPVKTINLPSYLYADSLKNIRVTFLMSPMLTPKDQLQFPTLKEAGYQWKWIYFEGTNNAQNPVPLPSAITIPARASIMIAVLDEQWDALKTGIDNLSAKLLSTATDSGPVLVEGMDASTTNTGRAYLYFNRVTATNLGAMLNISDPKQLDTITQQIMKILLTYHQGIDAVTTGAQFKPTEIREGWLELMEQIPNGKTVKT